MKLLIKISILFLALACQPSIPDINSEKKAIKEMLVAQQSAWNKGDKEGFMQGYWHHDSMQFISRKGTRYGWLNTLNAYKKNYPDREKMGTLSFNLENIRFLDTASLLAQVTGNWRIDYPADTALFGYFSLITKKISNHHKIIIDHTW